MLFLNSVRVAPGVRSALAVACGLALSGAQMARADDGVEPVVVTATRFQQSSAAVPANVSVITRQDILAMPGQSVPDILKSVAGVDVRPTYGALGIDATVDVGGFGTTANSNTLVLVDGQRLNPIDMGGILWSVIPKDGIERIEVIRGSGAVLYGDGASGGVINIITDRAQRKQAQASVSIGSFGYKAGDARLAGKNDLGFLSVNIHHAEEDGYRENNRQHEDSLSGRVGTSLGNSGQVFVDYSVFHDANGLPGGLDSAEYERDPRAANSRFNFQDRNGYRVRPGVSYHINDQLEVSADVAADHQQLKSHFVSTSDSSVSGSDRIRDTLSVSPRVRWQHGLGGLSSETVLGLDISEGNLISTDVGWPNQGGGQSSMSLYAQNITGLTSNLSLTLADRMQRVRQYARQDEYADWGTSSMDDSGTHTQHAYDIGLTYVADSWRVYGKTGTTFRFAKISNSLAMTA